MNPKDFNYIIDDIIKNINNNNSSILTQNDIDNIFIIIKDKHDINKLNYVMNDIKHKINKNKFNVSDIFRLKADKSSFNVKEGFVEDNKEIKSLNKKIVDSIENIIWDKNKNPLNIIVKNMYLTFLNLFEELLLIVVSGVIITNIFIRKRDIPKEILYPADPNKFPYVFYDGGDINNDKTSKHLVTCEIINKENYSKYEHIFDIVTTNQITKPEKNSSGTIDVEKEKCTINYLYDKEKCPNNNIDTDKYDINIINSFHNPKKENMNFFAKMFQNYNANRAPIQIWPSSLFSYIFLFTIIKLNLFMKQIEKYIPNLFKLKNDKIDSSSAIIWIIFVFILYYLLKKINLNITSLLPNDSKKGDPIYEILYLIIKIFEAFIKPSIFIFAALFVILYVVTCGYMCLGYGKYASAIKNKDAPLMWIYTQLFCFPIVLVQFMVAAYEVYKKVYSTIYCGVATFDKQTDGGSNKSDDKYSKQYQGKKGRGSAAIEEDYQRIYQVLLNNVQADDYGGSKLLSGIIIAQDDHSSEFTENSKKELEKLNSENKFKLYNKKKGKEEIRDIYRKKIKILTELHIEREKFIFGNAAEEDQKIILEAIFNSSSYNSTWTSREWKKKSNIKDGGTSTSYRRVESYYHYRDAMMDSVTKKGDLNALKSTTEHRQQEIDNLSDPCPFNSFQVGGGGGNDEDVERISDSNYGFRPLFDEDGKDRTREFVYDLWTLSDLHFEEYRNYVNKLDKCTHESRFNYEKVTNGNKLANKFSNYKKKCKKKRKFKEAFTSTREGFSTSCKAIKSEENSSEKNGPIYTFFKLLMFMITLPFSIPFVLPCIITGWKALLFSIDITTSQFGYIQKVIKIFGFKNIKLSFILLFFISIIHVIVECINHKYFLIRVPTLIILLISLFAIDIINSKTLKKITNNVKETFDSNENN